MLREVRANPHFSSRLYGREALQESIASLSTTANPPSIFKAWTQSMISVSTGKCKTVCLVVRIALPHDQNNVVGNNGNVGFGYRAESRISNLTCSTATSRPARKNQDGEDLTCNG